MQAWKVVLASVMVASAGVAAVAQDAPGQPPARERPGRERGQPPADRPGGERPEGERRAGRGMQLSPEKAKAAWELQARGVAKRLGLDEAKTAALVKAYADARASQGEALRKEMEKAREEREEGGFDPQAMRERREATLKAEREKFQGAVKGTLSEEQSAKVMASLGTFNQQWDRMADAVAGFNLDSAKQQEALNAIEDYAVAAGKVSASARDDREAAMAAMREAREKLTETMKKVLSEEQFGRFQAAMGPGGRGGPGGEGPRRRGGGEGGEGEGRPPGEGRRPGGGGGGGGGGGR